MKSRKGILLIIISVLFLHSLINFFILDKSKIIRDGDEVNYFSEIIHFDSILARGEYKNLIAYMSETAIVMHHPKFFFLVSSFIYNSFKKIGLEDINLIILSTNAFFLFILLVSVYQIGSIFYDRKTGLLAIVLLSFSPIIFGYSRMFLLDLPLAAMISLCLLLLLKTRNFDSLFFSIFTGISFSLAQYTKEAAIIFILSSFLYYSYSSLRIIDKKRHRFINFSIAIMLSLFLLGILYLNPSNKELFKIYWEKIFLVHSYKGEDLLYYVKIFPFRYLGIIFSIASLPLVLRYIFKVRKENLFLVLWFFIPFLIFSISHNKVPRFMIPALPPLYLILASEIFGLRPIKVRYIYIYALILISAFQYIKFNFFPRIPSGYSVHETGLLNIYKDKNFPVMKRLLYFFDEENVPSGKTANIIFTFREIQRGLTLEFLLNKMPFFINCPIDSDVVYAPPPGKTNWEEYLLTADYVVDKSGYIKWRGALEDITSAFKKSLEENAHIFKKVESFDNSDGDTISIYKKY